MTFKGNFIKIKRVLLAGVALSLVISLSADTFKPASANAFGMTTSRSVTLSNSNPGATNVSYSVQFTPSGSTSIAGIVVDFCSSSPDTSQACSSPSGFNVSSSPIVNSYSASMQTGGTWSAASPNNRTLVLNDTSAITTSNSTPLGFTLNALNNPSAVNTTFYARIFTYATATAANNYLANPTGQTPGTFVDEGGLAISTGDNLNIGFSVPETLTFCVFTNASCAAGGNSVTLGDNYGVLRNTDPFVDISTKYSLSTDANSGVIINIQGGLLTSSSGTSTIAAINGGSSTPAQMPAAPPSVSSFGLCSWGAGFTIASTYNGGGGINCSSLIQTAGTGSPASTGSTTFGYNTSAVGSTYGDQLAAAAGPTATITGTVAFAAQISNSQPSGIYTNKITFIATATY